jgi:signal peptidase II
VPHQLEGDAGTRAGVPLRLSSSDLALTPVTSKTRLFWPIVAVWLALDIVTKRLALSHLQPPGLPHRVLGNVVRLTLTFNQGAAMGMSLGRWSRPFFTVVGFAILGLLIYLYRRTAPADRLRTIILAFIVAGALGNLFDRLRWRTGVVDFVDIGVGQVRFWTFNLADSGITLGAIALALILGRSEKPAPPGG